jgi:small subunit ribosomal protein S20
MRNRSVKTRIKSAVKAVQPTSGEPAAQTADMSLDEAKSVIDKAAKQGVIHQKTAARKISRLSKAANPGAA